MSELSPEPSARFATWKPTKWKHHQEKLCPQSVGLYLLTYFEDCFVLLCFHCQREEKNIFYFLFFLVLEQLKHLSVKHIKS